MLYQRWQQIVRKIPGEIALSEFATGRRWTFAELDATTEKIPTVGNSSRIRFPSGRDVNFVLETLAAWRRAEILCPLETGATPPAPLETAIGTGGPIALPSDTAHLKATSATTGRPRLVAFTGHQLAADADNIVATMGLRRDWPNLGVISLAHSYGFSNLILPLLLHGIPLILADAPLPESIRRAAVEFGDLTLPAVPALWKAWHESGVLSTRIRLAISAGAPLPLSLEQAVFANTGLKIHNFYGATECGGIAYDRSEKPRADDACIGGPMENVALSVGATGCLEVRGAAVGTGYWPDAGSELDRGCFRSNDLTELVDGLVYLRGRAGDQINVAGRKVSPEVIERELRAGAGVRDCLVFGVPGADADRGDLIVACVVLLDPDADEPETRNVGEMALRKFLLARLPAWQVPREWRFLDSLTPNERGKLSRAEWRTRLGYHNEA